MMTGVCFRICKQYFFLLLAILRLIFDNESDNDLKLVLIIPVFYGKHNRKIKL